MEIVDLIDKAGTIVALVATAGILLLLPLYLSQRRDVIRLREWMEREPDHPASDIGASEILLDRAELELEELLDETGEAEAPPEPAGAPTPTPATGAPAVTAAQRVASERPALTRITMERAALEPHPRWRRFVARVTQPRLLIGIAVVALILGVAAIFGSEKLLELGDSGKGGGGKIDSGDISVFVLNGTDVGGLAAKVGDNVEENNFDLQHPLSTDPEHFDQSVVMFSKGQRAEAEKVARSLGINPVQPIDRQTQQLAGDADVVVIAGEDRAR
jgi:LytR cell envelope-related transcriptional attenuator